MFCLFFCFRKKEYRGLGVISGSGDFMQKKKWGAVLLCTPAAAVY